MNKEGHERFAPDTEQERHFFKPDALLSMTPDAIRMRRSRCRRYASEVAALRTTQGVKPNAPIGPVLREELWATRYRGTQASLFALAARFEQIAAEEGVSIEEVAARYEQQQVRPARQSAGERLAALVVDENRPDWVDPERLVRMVEPLDNGTPNPAYLRVVQDLDGSEFVLVTSYDGSEPMVWPHDHAGLKAGAAEALDRVRAVNSDPETYEAWESLNGVTECANPWTQEMSDADFLANTDRGMHLV